MQTQYATKNVPAAILLFAAILMNLLTRWANYQVMGGLPSMGIGFAKFVFSNPTSIIWWLGLIAAGVFLLMKMKPGVGVGFFVVAAINLIWLMQSFRFFFGAMSLLQSTLPALLELAAFVIAGLICVASAKMPHSNGFVALPSIMFVVIIVIILVGRIVNLIQAIGYSDPTFAALALVGSLAFDICIAIALLFACQWAMDDYLGKRQPQPASGTAPFAGEAAQQLSWFCPKCGTQNTNRFCKECGTQVPERFASQIDTMRATATGHQAGAISQQTNGGQPLAYGQANPLDTGSFGWAVLGFFVPLAGLILWIVWKADRPNSAKKAGMGALVSVIVSVVITIIEIIVIVAVGSSMMYY